MNTWLFLIPIGIVVLVFIIIDRIGLWHGSGNLFDLIKSLRVPEPRQLPATISLEGGQGAAPYHVTVKVDLRQPVAEVSPAYLSFALDTSQVVGGKWWDPAADHVEIGSGTLDAPVFDFDRPQLDTLVRALAPAYLRIGGSEADKVYYNLDAASRDAATIPAGYESVLTRDQWDAANAFVARNGLELMFTLNTGPASRTADGHWNPENAAALLAYTAQRGYPVAVWELGNELNAFWAIYGLPAQVRVDQYHEDLKQAKALVAQYTPAARFTGQGSAFWPLVGEILARFFSFTPHYLARSGDVIDLVTWHYYPQQSRRGPFAVRPAHPARLLDPGNLDEVAIWADRMSAWRDQHAPGKALWLGETGNAQFGGEPGVSDTYIGGLWWLDQLGLLARHGHEVVIRQTLVGMNYGMLDDDLTPRPDYWNSLLWKRLMGTQVYALDVQGEDAEKLRCYAHWNASAHRNAFAHRNASAHWNAFAHRNASAHRATFAHRAVSDEGVTILVINLDHQRDATIAFPDFVGRRYELYALNAPDVLGKALYLNGAELKLDEGGALPPIQGVMHEGGDVPHITLHPLSYAFVSFSL